MKATKIAWTVILRDILSFMVAEGVEFRDPKGHLVEAPGDIWALMQKHGRVNVQFLDMERGKNGLLPGH
jgi:hypothetical protein